MIALFLAGIVGIFIWSAVSVAWFVVVGLCIRYAQVIQVRREQDLLRKGAMNWLRRGRQTA